MKHGWNEVTLGKVAEFRPNKREVRRHVADGMLVSFVPMDCLNAGDRNLAIHTTRSIADVYKNYTYFGDGDVLLAKITPCFENGKLGVARELKNGIGFGSSEFFVIRPGKEILSDYIYYYLHQQYFRDAGKRVMTGAVGHKRVPREFLEAHPIPLPPLEEQRRIVAVLDEAFEGLDHACAHAEANLLDAQEIFKSYLCVTFNDETISWTESELADLGVIQTGSTPKTSEPDNLGDFIPFIKPGDFRDDGSLVYNNQRLSKKGASVSRIIPAGSALMVCIGATIGKAGFTNQEIATNQQINSITPHSGVSGEYIYNQLITPEFQAAVVRNAGQATLPIINKGKWSRLRIKLPSNRKKQSVIANKLRELRRGLDQVQTRYRDQLSSLDDLRQSLLHGAFAGELR